MPESRDIRSPSEIDLLETRRRFLFAREQAAQESTRYGVIREMRRWPAPRPASADRHPGVRAHSSEP
jgi:hypothetical protein